MRLVHRPELDGVRGIAILLVVLAHNEVPLFAGGRGTGVVLFFVLSGYLITSILLAEVQRDGRIDVPRFLLRRARRLVPALLVLVVAACGLGWVPWRDGALASLQLSNFAVSRGISDLGLLLHTWSLSTEEQFYVLLPILILAAGSPRRLRGVAIAGIIGVTLWRIVAWRSGASQVRLEYAFDMRADALLAGALLATLPRMAGRPMRRIPAAATAIVLLVLTARSSAFSTWVQVDLPLATLGASGLVWYGATTSSRALAHPVLVWAGRRSYSLYLWHAALLWAAFDQIGPLSWLDRAALLPLTLTATEVSYRLVEQRFRTRSSVDALGHRGATLVERGARPLPASA